MSISRFASTKEELLRHDPARFAAGLGGPEVFGGRIGLIPPGGGLSFRSRGGMMGSGMGTEEGRAGGSGQPAG